MGLNRKIPAFTLVEMLVVLAITAIVAGLAFTIITLFSRNMQHIESNFNKGTERNLFRDQLMVDFNRYHTIHYDPMEMTLTFKNPLDSIQYLWEENETLRETDTLLREPMDLELFYAGERVERGAVDALKVSFGDRENDYIFIFRENDAFGKIGADGD